MRCECLHCLSVMKINGIDGGSGRSRKLVERLIKGDRIFSLVCNDKLAEPKTVAGGENSFG